MINILSYGSLVIFKYQEYDRSDSDRKKKQSSRIWLAAVDDDYDDDHITTRFYLFIYDFALARYFSVNFHFEICNSHAHEMENDSIQNVLYPHKLCCLNEQMRSCSLPDYYHLRLLFIFMCLLKCVIHDFFFSVYTFFFVRLADWIWWRCSCMAIWVL